MYMEEIQQLSCDGHQYAYHMKCYPTGLSGSRDSADVLDETLEVMKSWIEANKQKFHQDK